jgi:hypothetical protein
MHIVTPLATEREAAVPADTPVVDLALGLDELDGPTDAELEAIEAEWPSIEADLAVVDAWIAATVAVPVRDELASRRARRRRRARLAAARRVWGVAA